jgi:RimJ/RimL family protein N-acetyltransferase
MVTTTRHDVRSSTPPGATPRPLASAVELRSLERGDRSCLLEIFAGLSPRSRQLRFLTPKPRLTGGDLRQLTAVDHHDHVAVVAISRSTGRPIGVGRFVREPGQPGSADVALAVVDAWQNRGVGTLLAQALAQRAREVGVRRFTLVMHPDNQAVLRMLHRLGGVVTRLAHDPETLELAVTLDGERARGLRWPRPPATLQPSGVGGRP